MEKKIPNFDTLSTLLDRLSIENVKLAHFENILAHDNPSEDERISLEHKISTQQAIIDKLKHKTTEFMKDIFITGTYDYIKEERTFT